MLSFNCATEKDLGGSEEEAKASTASVEVQRLWSRNREILVKSASVEEINSAVKFFEETTGILSIASYSYVGRMPSLDSKGELKKWDEWYVKNSPLLFVDPLTGRIKRKSP